MAGTIETYIIHPENGSIASKNEYLKNNWIQRNSVLKLRFNSVDEKKGYSRCLKNEYGVDKIIEVEKEHILKTEFMMLLYYCTDNIIFFEFPFNGEIFSYVIFNYWELDEDVSVTFIKVVPDPLGFKTEYVEKQFPFEMIWEVKDEFISHLKDILNWKHKDFLKIYRKTRECELIESYS